MGCNSSKATKTAKSEVAVNDAQPVKTLLAAEAGKAGDPGKAGEAEAAVAVVKEEAEAAVTVVKKEAEAAAAAVKEGPAAIVKVSIVKARGLRNADCLLADKSDPYCICEVTGESDTKIETSVAADKLNPEWNFDGEINMFRVGNSLTFTVKDKDPVKPDDVLGKATLTTTQFFPNGFDAEVPLLQAGEGVEAFLTVKITVVHPKVRVSVLSARALRNADWIGKSDPYCICEVVGKSDSKFETASIAESLNPTWNHEAELLGYQIQDSISFTVNDNDPAKLDDILGRVVLPCESFLESGFEGELQLAETSPDIASFLKVKVELGEKTEEPNAVDESTVVDKLDEAIVCETVEQREVAKPEHAPADIIVDTTTQPAKTWCC